MFQRAISQAKLARETGIDPASLNRCFKGKYPWFPAYREKIAEYLNLSEKELFEEGEILIK